MLDLGYGRAVERPLQAVFVHVPAAHLAESLGCSSPTRQASTARWTRAAFLDPAGITRRSSELLSKVPGWRMPPCEAVEKRERPRRERTLPSWFLAVPKSKRLMPLLRFRMCVSNLLNRVPHTRRVF